LLALTFTLNAEPTIEEIQTAIETRLGDRQNYSISWEASWVEPKGSKTPTLLTLKDKRAMSGELDPPEDAYLQSSGQIITCGPWKRVSCLRDKFDFNGVLQRDWENVIGIWNAGREVTWSSRPAGSADPITSGHARIQDKSSVQLYGIPAFDELCNSTFEAPRIRPAFASDFVGADFLVLRVEPSALGNLVVVGNPPTSWDPGETRYEFFLDPAKGYALTRYRTMHGLTGEVISDISYSYVESPEFGWIPARAEVLLFLGSVLTRIGDISIQIHSFNPEFDRSLFDFQFPVGTLVDDETKNLEYTVESPAQGDAWADEILGAI